MSTTEKYKVYISTERFDINGPVIGVLTKVVARDDTVGGVLLRRGDATALREMGVANADNLSHTIDVSDYNCAERTAARRNLILLDDAGRPLHGIRSPDGEPYKRVDPGSLGDDLLRAACKLAEETLRTKYAFLTVTIRDLKSGEPFVLLVGPMDQNKCEPDDAKFKQHVERVVDDNVRKHELAFRRIGEVGVFNRVKHPEMVTERRAQNLMRSLRGKPGYKLAADLIPDDHDYVSLTLLVSKVCEAGPPR